MDSDIKKELLHGLFWSAIEKYSGIIISIIITMVLSRLLEPSQFGIIAIATVFIQFLAMFTNMGIGPAIIQRSDLTNSDLNSIYTLTFVWGGALSILFFLCSWLVSNIYNDLLLVPICQLLTINLFFSAINMVPRSLMSKRKRFKEIAKCTLFFQIFTGAISIVAAINGLGVYSLLISPIATSIGVYFYNLHYCNCQIIKNVSLDPIKKIFSYSSYQFLNEFVVYFSNNLDKMIIGKTLTAAQLGYYEKSYRLMQMPLNMVTSVLNPVVQPILVNLQDNPSELGIKFGKMIKVISIVGFPLGIFLFFAGEDLILLMFGNQWDLSVSVFKIFSVCVPFKLIMSAASPIFLTANSTKQLFFVSLRNSISTILGFIVASYFFGTIEAIAWSFVINVIIWTLISISELFSKILKQDLSLLIIYLKAPLFICVVSIFISLFCLIFKFNHFFNIVIIFFSVFLSTVFVLF